MNIIPAPDNEPTMISARRFVEFSYSREGDNHVQ